MPIVRQISIFLKNKPGALATLTRSIKGARVNLVAISVPDTRDQGVLHLVPDDPKALKSMLQQKGIMFAETKVLQVETSNQPGGLYEITQKLKTAKIDVDYAYGSSSPNGGDATLILQVSDLMRAKQILG